MYEGKLFFLLSLKGHSWAQDQLVSGLLKEWWIASAISASALADTHPAQVSPSHSAHSSEHDAQSPATAQVSQAQVHEESFCNIRFISMLIERNVTLSNEAVTKLSSRDQ